MTVSVLIPSHNRKRLLRKTLDSLQEVQPPSDTSVEVVVVANACTDGTLDMLSRLAATFPYPLRYFNEEKLGVNFAKNRCLKEANGDVLAFVDDDVKFDCKWLKELTRVFEKYEPDVVGGRIKLWWDVVDEPVWFDSRLSPVLGEYDRGEKVKEVDLPSPHGGNLALHRRVYETIGKLETGFQNDDNTFHRGSEVEYLQRAADAGYSGYYAPDALVYHWVKPQRIEQEFFAEAGWGYGHSRIGMKKKFGLLAAVRSVTGFLYLAGWHGLHQFLARWTGDTAGRYYHSYVKNIGLGGLHGSFLRLKDKRFG